MPGELFEIEGEKKKRVVWVLSFFITLFSPLVPHTCSAISSTLTSEGSTMVPDTRMSLFAMIMNNSPKRVLDLA